MRSMRPFVMDIRNATGLREAQALYARPSLLEQLGSKSVQIGTSTNIIGGNRGRGNDEWKFKTALDAMRGAGPQAKAAERQRVDVNDPFYVFDRDSIMRQARRLRRALKAVLAGVVDPLVGNPILYLAVGESGSGTHFHKHSEGWNLQLHGHKHWLLMPLDSMPRNYPETVQSILDTSRKVNDTRVLRCTVHPGQVLFLPESFYHATISIGESVSVAGQARQALTAVQREWDQADGAHGNNHLSEASWRYARASEMVPWCPEIWYLRGLVTHKMGMFQASIRHLVRIIQMDATHHHTWNMLGASLWHSRLPKVAPMVTRQGELRPPMRTRGPKSRRRYAGRCKARSEYLAQLDM